MNASFIIAKKDLKSLFSSPKAGAVFFFFLIFMGSFFHNYVTFIAEAQSQSAQMGAQIPSIAQLFEALFKTLHFILILIVPAITMGTFAEERKNQSIRMLQTAPITPLQIVLGKFLATAGMMGLVLLASLAIPLYLLNYANPDPNIIWSSYLGMMLLVCSQLAFGIWVSSMTKNQIMAFIFTMFGLFLLLILNWLAPNLTSTDLMASFLKYIASSDHFDAFLKGIISTADVAYFLLFAGTFLFFTNIVIDSQRWR